MSYFHFIIADSKYNAERDHKITKETVGKGACIT